MSSLPKGAVADLLNQKVVTLLYRDLPHPPASYIGDTYAWRQPDGSHNNPAQPDLGKAGTPYARSVQGVTAMPMCELPDPGLVFDSLLKRERFVPHPAGLSAMMFGFATLVIHTCFRTNLKVISLLLIFTTLTITRIGRSTIPLRTLIYPHCTGTPRKTKIASDAKMEPE